MTLAFFSHAPVPNLTKSHNLYCPRVLHRPHIQSCSQRPSSSPDLSMPPKQSSTLDPKLSQPRPGHGYEAVLNCVLKVFCTHCEPNYELPWAMTAQRQSTSSAFVIEGRRILTNAHSVEHYTTVMVKKRYSDTKYMADVIAIGNECDIALLEVRSDQFWDEFDHHVGLDVGRHPFLSPGPLPELQDPVLVIGYPSPGNQISVTAGVSSRVEMQHYVHGQGELLAVQIDAAVSCKFLSSLRCCTSFSSPNLLDSLVCVFANARGRLTLAIAVVQSSTKIIKQSVRFLFLYISALSTSLNSNCFNLVGLIPITSLYRHCIPKRRSISGRFRRLLHPILHRTTFPRRHCST